MMKRQTLAIADIYVPVKRRTDLEPAKVQEIAESMLQAGQQTPILVRQDGERFVLIEGLHRLEACRQLGEKTIFGWSGLIKAGAVEYVDADEEEQAMIIMTPEDLQDHQRLRAGQSVVDTAEDDDPHAAPRDEPRRNTEAHRVFS